MAGKEVVRWKRNTIGIASATVILGGGLWIFYLLRPTAIPVNGMPSAVSLESSREVNEARINKAKHLREAWQPWAVKHKDTLHAMLNPQPGREKEALSRAYEALPPDLTDDGTTGIRYRDLDSGGLGYTWPAVSKLHGKPSSDSKKLGQAVAKEQEYTSKHLQTQYEKFHDIEIASSVNAGPTHTTLWASGRITVATSEIVHSPRGSTLKEGIPREIAPPYDEFAH